MKSSLFVFALYALLALGSAAPAVENDAQPETKVQKRFLLGGLIAAKLAAKIWVINAMGIPILNGGSYYEPIYEPYIEYVEYNGLYYAYVNGQYYLLDNQYVIFDDQYYYYVNGQYIPANVDEQGQTIFFLEGQGWIYPEVYFVNNGWYFDPAGTRRVDPKMSPYIVRKMDTKTRKQVDAKYYLRMKDPNAQEEVKEEKPLPPQKPEEETVPASTEEEGELHLPPPPPPTKPTQHPTPEREVPLPPMQTSRPAPPREVYNFPSMPVRQPGNIREVQIVQAQPPRMAVQAVRQPILVASRTPPQGARLVMTSRRP